MRVIGGSVRGRRLKGPRGPKVRPTADRVREALFNILGWRTVDAVFLDLFAGCGAVGIEALSRGARLAVFAERDRACAALIRENLARTGLSRQARIMATDALAVLAQLEAENFKAGLVFMDPPYDYAAHAALVKNLVSRGLVEQGGLIVVEHAAADRDWPAAFKTAATRRYGDSALTIISHPEEEQKH